jgi:hypothetical protein
LRRSWRHDIEVEHREVVELAAFRDVLGLKLPAHKKLAQWEQFVIEGGMHVMHEEFCIVFDFPEIMRSDERNRPHCADGPSHRWRDGWAPSTSPRWWTMQSSRAVRRDRDGRTSSPNRSAKIRRRQ